MDWMWRWGLTGIRELSGLTHVSDVTNSNGTYNCDAFEFTRYFSPDLLLDKHFGDWTTICETPSIVKTRPLSGDNINNVILNLDKVRHFVFLKDKSTFASKWDKAVFRGAAYQPHRRRFMEKFFGHPLVDCGNTAEKRYRVVSALFGKIERLTFTGTFDAFQHLVKSHSFKQICSPIVQRWGF